MLYKSRIYIHIHSYNTIIYITIYMMPTLNPIFTYTYNTTPCINIEPLPRESINLVKTNNCLFKNTQSQNDE